MSEGTITKRLDLLIRLADTTTGYDVAERNVLFYRGKKQIYPQWRGDGSYILINQGREDGPMQILAYGYEPFEAMLSYEAMDEGLPTLDAFLIPSERERPGQQMLSLSGRLEGLTSIEAIHLGRPLTSFREYDAKRRTMSVYIPNRRMAMVHTYYGICDATAGMFESVTVTEELADRRVRIKEPLTHEFKQNSPIFRRIFGQVSGDGRYLLRVRDDGENQKHMVKLVINGEAIYQRVDLRTQSEIVLDEKEEML